MFNSLLDRESILRTVFETEAETLILPLAFDLTEKVETRILPLVIENCPDYCNKKVVINADRNGEIKCSIGLGIFECVAIVKTLTQGRMKFRKCRGSKKAFDLNCDFLTLALGNE